MHLNFKIYNALGSYVTKTMPILKNKMVVLEFF